MHTESLLATKLYAPPLRDDLVPRPRLVHKLNEGLQRGRRLTLVSAPAGYGKTTLISEWLSQIERPATWLSLDRGDNQLSQFMAYVVAALHEIDDTIGPHLLAGSESPAAPGGNAGSAEQALTALINAATRVATPFVLVLDDYHLITELAVHEAMGFLIDHQPPSMHLVITSRQDPLLPLARLRSRGHITDIRAGDLRFTVDETSAFLNEAMRLDLSTDQIATFESRTEGWIAGLQLAALSLTEQADRSTFIRAFAGDDRYVMDYLMDEVLSRQPASMQRFLLNTSILKQLCGALCDAVLAIETPATAGPPSAALLEQLERANLFIIPLDNRRHWYRYHHLFADLLNRRLQQTCPDQAAGLHWRASEWYEREGMIADAIDHALLCEDFDRAGHLIEQEGRASIWSSGELPTLQKWVSRLPDEVVRSHPRLSLYHARGLFFNGHVGAAEYYLNEAEQALRAKQTADPAVIDAWGALYTNRATVAAMRGETGAALDLSEVALKLLPAGDASTRARVAHARGVAHLLRGHPGAAAGEFEQSVRLAQSVNNRNLGLDVAGYLAMAFIDAGKLAQAAGVCEQVLSAKDSDQLPAACSIHLALAKVHHARHDLDAAMGALEVCVELGQRVAWPHILWQAHALSALVLQARGDGHGARAALQKAEGIAQTYGVPPVADLISAYRARLALMQGDLEPAAGWADRYLDAPRVDYRREFEDLTFIRVRIAQARHDEALSSLEALLSSAGKDGRARTEAELQVLRTRALAARGDVPAALAALLAAMVLAEPDGYTQPFLEGDDLDLIALLERLDGRDRRLTRFRAHLLGLLQGTAGARPIPLAATPVADWAAYEPMTERERQVLRLIEQGLSNPEIARRLFISVPTVKSHTLNLYGKLGVNSRMQAVARAKSLGLL